jgi:hypothetical protein
LGLRFPFALDTRIAPGVYLIDYTWVYSKPAWHRRFAFRIHLFIVIIAIVVTVAIIIIIIIIIITITITIDAFVADKDPRATAIIIR